VLPPRHRLHRHRDLQLPDGRGQRTTLRERMLSITSRSRYLPLRAVRSFALESGQGAVPGLLPSRFPGPPSAPDKRVSTHPALHGFPLAMRRRLRRRLPFRGRDAETAPAVAGDLRWPPYGSRPDANQWIQALSDRDEILLSSPPAVDRFPTFPAPNWTAGAGSVRVFR
jgi:hypothetical protein